MSTTPHLVAERPVPGHPRPYDFPDTFRTELANGTRVIVVPMPGSCFVPDVKPFGSSRGYVGPNTTWCCSQVPSRRGKCTGDCKPWPIATRHSLLKTKLSSLGVRSHFVSAGAGGEYFFSHSSRLSSLGTSA